MLHEFYHDKNILITGNTGFKGSWLSLWLTQMGAQVHGIALEPLTSSDHFVVTRQNDHIDHTVVDIRNFDKLNATIQSIKPEIIFHLAAQPIVIDSYDSPLYTFETNVMGTANVLEASRQVQTLKSIIVITTDKCYENREWDYSYRENDALGGYDPYSSSKAAAEIVTQAYRRSFYNGEVSVCTARAGNVIGGGDWQKHRLVPDLMRAVQANETMHIRNPNSIRPWQHVLEPLRGYLMLAKKSFDHPKACRGAWNFGPDAKGSVSVDKVMQIARSSFKELPVTFGNGEPANHEAELLLLDSSKAGNQLGWYPTLNLEETIDMTVQWYAAFFDKKDMHRVSVDQIKRFEEINNAD